MFPCVNHPISLPSSSTGHAGFTFALRLMPVPPLFTPEYSATQSLPRHASVDVVTGGMFSILFKFGFLLIARASLSDYQTYIFMHVSCCFCVGDWTLCVRALDSDAHVSVTARTIAPFHPLELKRGVPEHDKVNVSK